MKYVNFYSGTALALIASLLGSLGAATGQMAPPLIVGALLFTVLVLGWAGGASDARAELDRLTRLEFGRQLLAQSHIRQRDQLEASNEALRAQVKDCQAAIEVFTAAQAGTMVRITALEGENAELRARTTAEIAAVSWPLQPYAVVIGRAMGSDDLELAMFDGFNYCFSDGDCLERDGDTLDGFTAEFLTQHQLEQRLIAAHLDAGSVAVLRTENAELRKRPSSEVMIETAVRLMRENSADEDSDEEYLNGRVAGIAHMHTELVQHMMAQAPNDSLTGSASTSAAGAQS